MLRALFGSFDIGCVKIEEEEEEEEEDEEEGIEEESSAAILATLVEEEGADSTFLILFNSASSTSSDILNPKKHRWKRVGRLEHSRTRHTTTRTVHTHVHTSLKVSVHSLLYIAERTTHIHYCF